MENHLVETQQLTRDFLFKLFKRADELRNNSLRKNLSGKILASLFYEPSTRTRLSFESAMIKLGGRVIGTENAKEFSSAFKGESIEDTVRVISKYADIIVMRHDTEGSVKIASEVSEVPIVNAGDGKGQHPTQAILDLYTIYREFGSLGKIKIALVGDLASGRTVRSLCYLLGKFSDIEIIFVSPKNLQMKEDILDYLRRKGINFHIEDNLEKVISYVDVVYMTRIQKERITKEEYENAKGKFLINESNINLLKENSIIMHPLPHVEEINLSLETEKTNKKVAYFRQAENGLYIRMAILEELLSD